MSMKHPSLVLAGIAAAMCVGPTAVAAEEARYIVKYQQGKGQAVRAQMQASKGKMKLDLPGRGAMAVMLSPAALKAMQNHPNVEYVEEDVKRYLLAEQVPYGIPMVQADQLSDAAAGNTKVCIIDSGYDGGHEDLYQGAVVNGTNDPGTGSWNTDENGHGTHVAGTIAGIGNNGTGVIGVLPSGNLNLHIIKVFGADGWAYSSGLVAALDACKAAKGSENMVINMSLGGDRKSRTEERAFAQADSEGILSIAAAGNDGNTRHSYPASYSSVVSVAAIDSAKVVADFSQQTDQVEMAGPGVGVLSTVPMGSASIAALTVAGGDVDAAGMEGSPQGSATGQLVDCGTGEAACTAAAGNICLIARGNISFSDKVLACEAGGGVGAIIYNNEPGQLYGTLGGVATTIPSVGISDTDGAALMGQQGASATIDVTADHYAYFNGTSMATPHVVGVAALVWSNNETCSNAEVRAALNATAEDLGAAGRDNAYGHGLVQAKAASDYLATNGCGGGDTGGGGGGGGNGGGKPNKGPKR
ncbi:peptidase S8 and S53 subtilisin kexin sedolisin [Ferrimonas balearica DSM 9799]|uniref:Peptidase S8 and S53 subtilisin kexin sedolisin n=1 Tax=Ferrimonas balearica (strain DSM 9799 / CCM 4581 / KCTC 23876 / PAT) TaxID=550540 RepID=E1SP26_FERBD|nr:S8 family serine peptidase [Ferrimonas balearica]ADN74675.1 peptidase S8 and S53 subtilisin kexin sedolisin [Ferrimonas balearica DSM 9799]